MISTLKTIPATFTITIALCLWYLCLTGAPVLIDPDTAWHLAAGDLWRSSGIITSDPWGWTSEGKTWVNMAWAFDVIISWLHEHSGFAILYPLCLIIVSTLIGIQVMQAQKKGAIIPVLIFITALLVFQIYSSTLLRPNLVTLIFTLCSYYLLVTENPLWIKRRSALLPLITIVWVNMHGGFLYLFLLFFVFGLELLFKKHWKPLSQLTLLGIVCLVCTGVNPFGYEILTTSFAGMSTPFNSIINEWKPINFAESYRMLFLLVLLLVGGGFMDSRIRIADRLLIITLFYLTLTSQRHSVMLALFCIPYLGITITHVVREMDQLQWIENRFQSFSRNIAIEDLRIVGGFMLMFVVIFVASPWPRDLLLKNPIGISKDIVAAEDLTYLQKHYAHEKILNHYDLGGHLIFYGRGIPKLFIDGRSNTSHPEQVLTDYRDFMQFAGQDMKGRKVHEKYGFKAVLIPNNIEERDSWDDNYFWRRVYEGGAFSIYEPR